MGSGIVEKSGEQQQGQSGGSISRAKLVQRLLAASANLPAFINDLLTTQAVVVAGTEAAGFIIEQQQTENGESGFGLRPIAHIRPDNSDASIRAAAINAFQEIIGPCIAQGKDGAIPVGEGNGEA